MIAILFEYSLKTLFNMKPSSLIQFCSDLQIFRHFSCQICLPFSLSFFKLAKKAKSFLLPITLSLSLIYLHTSVIHKHLNLVEWLCYTCSKTRLTTYFC